MIARPALRSKPLFRQVVFAALLFAGVLTAQSAKPGAERDVDPVLAQLISKTLAIDNHVHVVLPPPQDKTDRGFDALPVDNMEPATDPIAWRADNPQLPLAWQALWQFSGTAPLDPEGLKRLETARSLTRTREAGHYDDWLLEQAGIGTALSNRVAMDPSIPAPRFLWVPYADALLFPLSNTAMAEITPDRQLFFPMEDRLRTRYLQAQHLAALSPTLQQYLTQVVTPTLEQQHAAGAVAEKFEIAYLRSFDFTDPTEAAAERVYTRQLHAARPDPADYKLLQDFLFRYIAAECGRLGMAVHLHTMAGGGAYFGVGGGSPMLLESIFNDPHLRKTKFVMLHGGWPYVHEAGALLQKPNVFLDVSQEALTIPPRTLATFLREWLELYPDKVLFGTDGYPYTDSMGWEESTWISSHNARTALGLALTGMLQDGEISRTRAEEIAVKVLRGNAVALYKLP